MEECPGIMEEKCEQKKEERCGRRRKKTVKLEELEGKKDTKF